MYLAGTLLLVVFLFSTVARGHSSAPLTFAPVEDGTLHVHDLRSREQVASLRCGSPVNKVSVAGVAAFVGTEDGSVLGWDVRNFQYRAFAHLAVQLLGRTLVNAACILMFAQKRASESEANRVSHSLPPRRLGGSLLGRNVYFSGSSRSPSIALITAS